ncbi:MAG: prepilin-type N-terminal cleavage/methylation domain-containing protein [Dehalococcoidia bacterium]|nr:MAG: prepilin-type N-terminal cleavage/methylation domain-containing protein [Dehalococcoidia bacterium]
MRLSSTLYKSERGFTLLEILVVVAILGTLAAIVIPSILNMQGEGRVDSANTEHHNVQIAVLSSMVDHSVTLLNDIPGGFIGPKSDGSGNESNITELTPPSVPDGEGITSYISKLLQATYTMDEYGIIINATPTNTQAGNSKWNGLSYDQGAGIWFE